MDFTGRRQSDNVDDRRKNWRIYEAFRPLRPQPPVVADNQHTRAVDRLADHLLRTGVGPNPFASEPEGDWYSEGEIKRIRRPQQPDPVPEIEYDVRDMRTRLAGPMSQDEFDAIVSGNEYKSPPIIGNLLRK